MNRLPRPVLSILCVCTFAVTILCFAALNEVRAQSVSEVQPLDFGTWIVINNDSVQTMTVNLNGSFSSTPGAINIDPPQEGIYDFIEFVPPFYAPTVVVTMTQSLQGGSSEFTLSAFQTDLPAADADGTTTLTLGATASSTGTGEAYSSSNYTGEIQIDINL